MPRAPNPPLCVGIDVSAKTLHVAWRTLRDEVHENQFSNDDAGFVGLIALLKAGNRPRRVVVEATGTYHVDLALALVGANVAVMVVNPLSTYHHAGVKLRRAKTDPIDAKDLLDYCERNEFVPWKVPPASVLELRDVTRRIAALIEQRTMEKNRLHAARAKAGTPVVVLRDIEDAIVYLSKRIRELEKAGVALINRHPELREASRLITSVKGIAVRSGMRILAELLVLPQDLSPKQVVAYAGLDPRPFQSGTSRDAQRRISRVGNKRLRAALFMPTMVAARWEPAIKAVYEAMVARKGPKSKLLALTAMSRRLLQVVWQMLRTRQVFDATKFGPGVRNQPIAA